jgi:signal peptidase I
MGVDMRLSRWVRPRFSVLIIAAFILLWLIFAPVQLGGNKAYVIVTGSSMAPEFQFGDLVIVHQDSHYLVGDAVAYTDPYIGPVFHRIIDYYGERFVLKGDDNYWIDPHYPTHDEIIGKLWVRFPGIGKYVKVLREPANYTIMVIAFVGITFFPQKRPKKPKRKREKREKVIRRMPPWERFYEIVIVIGVVAVFALIFVIFSFSKPTTQLVDRQVILNHTGSFDYSAEAVVGVYDNPHASAGEPVFLNISDTIEVQFDYELGERELSDVQGTYEVIAQISDDTGWKRTFIVSPMTAFEGESFTVSSLIYIPKINRVIARFEQITGVTRSTFDLSVIPRIQLVGNYHTQEGRNQFSPSLNFQMSESLIWMLSSEDDPDPFTVTEVSSISIPVIEANTVSFFTWQIPVLTIRIISSLIFVAVLAIGGWYGWEMYQVSKKGEYKQIVFYYGDEIINLKKPPKFENVIEVETFKALVNLAKNYGVKVLHIYQRKRHDFYLPLEDGVFLYKTEETSEKG